MMWCWILVCAVCAVCAGRGELVLSGRYRLEGRGTVLVRGKGDFLLLQVMLVCAACWPWRGQVVAIGLQLNLVKGRIPIVISYLPEKCRYSMCAGGTSDLDIDLKNK